MASACLNSIALPSENLLECSQKFSNSYGWFSPRLSISREEHASRKNKRISPAINVADLPEASDPAKECSDLAEESGTNKFDGFEFRIEDPVMMLPADELFSDGKLLPMQFSVIRQQVATSESNSLRRIEDDPYMYSPRAPRCSSRWRELLGFRKVNQSVNNNSNGNGKVDNKRTTSLASSNNSAGATRSIRQFLYRSSKSSTDSPINLPLLKDADTESVSVSVSSRPSLSSSSSGHDIDDLPRLSLDSDKQAKPNRPKTRMVKTRTQSQSSEAIRVGRSTLRRSSAEIANRGLSVDSPRMNSSGKIVFHSLERSSSSPSSLNNIAPRSKQHRGVERSYSANVRVLNVPVCSLRGSSKSGGMFGFPMFSSQQKREACSGSNNGGSNRNQRFHAGKSESRLKI